MPHPPWLEQARPSGNNPRVGAASGDDSAMAETWSAGDIYSAIVQAAPDPIVAVDTRGLIIQWNSAAERVFGYTRAQAIGAPMVESIIPPRLREAHMRGFSRQGGEQAGILGRRIETHAMRSDGSEFRVSLAINRLDRAGETAFAAYFRDLSGER